MELSPEERRRVYEEEKARLEAQSAFNAERRGRLIRNIGIGCLCVTGMFVVLTIVENRSSVANPPHSEPSEHFYSDTLSYGGTASEQLLRVTRTMAGVSASNFAGLREAFLTARSVENSRYEDYLRTRNREGVPGNSRDIADNADEVHRLFQETMGDFLMYWGDRNTAHIADGSATLKRCAGQAEIMVSTINARR